MNYITIKIIRQLPSTKTLMFMAFGLILFNYIDGLLSWWIIIHLGIGFEANPLMAWLMTKGSSYFLAYKFIATPFLSMILYQARELSLAKWGLITLFFTYFLLMLWFAANLLLMFHNGYF